MHNVLFSTLLQILMSHMPKISYFIIIRRVESFIPWIQETIRD